MVSAGYVPISWVSAMQQCTVNRRITAAFYNSYVRLMSLQLSGWAISNVDGESSNVKGG
jgi:hypothetical protein